MVSRRNFAERNHRVLVTVTINRHEVCTLGNQTRTVRGEQNQLKAVRQLVNAVFDGDARHEACTPAKGLGLARLLATIARRTQAKVPPDESRPEFRPPQSHSLAPDHLHHGAAIVGLVIDVNYPLPWVTGWNATVSAMAGRSLGAGRPADGCRRRQHLQ